MDDPRTLAAERLARANRQHQAAWDAFLRARNGAEAKAARERWGKAKAELQAAKALAERFAMCG